MHIQENGETYRKYHSFSVVEYKKAEEETKRKTQEKEETRTKNTLL